MTLLTMFKELLASSGPFNPPRVEPRVTPKEANSLVNFLRGEDLVYHTANNGIYSAQYIRYRGIPMLEVICMVTGRTVKLCIASRDEVVDFYRHVSHARVQ